MAEERLKRREAQLAEREIDLLKRELNMMIVQTNSGTPTPKKRKGNFKKKLLKQKEEKISSVISAPSGKFGCILFLCRKSIQISIFMEKYRFTFNTNEIESY